MKISPEKFERLLWFLDAEMDPGELDAFEQEIKSDPDLREQLNLQVQLAEGFSKKTVAEAQHIDNEESLRSILIEAKSKFIAAVDSGPIAPVIHINRVAIEKEQHKQPYSIHVSRWLAAASVVVLALLAILVYYSGKNNEVNNLANNDADSIKNEQRHIVINPLDTITKQMPDRRAPIKMDYASLASETYVKDKGPADAPQLLVSELSDYDAGSYDAIQAFDLDNIPKTRGNNEFAIKELGHYYKGLSFIETKNNALAGANLQWVLDSSKDGSLKIKASWYLAIVYLKMGDLNKSESLLNHVASNRTEVFYKQRAAALIIKINGGNDRIIK